MASSKRKLVIIGAGEFAEIAYEYFTYDSPYEVVAFAVEQEYLKKTTLFDLPVVPFESMEKTYDPADHSVFIAVTYTQLNRVRTRLYEAAKRKGYAAVSYVSSKAFVWRNVSIGENCFVFEHNVLQYSSRIGNNVVLWSGNHIGHRAIVHANVFISSHVVVSGYCEIGESCFIGVNATIADFVKVGRDCIIGAGAVVLKNTEPEKVYRGNPAVAAAVSSLRAFNVKNAQ